MQNAAAPQQWVFSLHLVQVRMTARAVGKPSQGQHQQHISPELERASLQNLRWKCPAELHCSLCQPGVPAVMTYLLCICTTVDFRKCRLTRLMSHIHPRFAEPGWAWCLVSQSFISRPLDDALFPSDSRGNQRELGVQILLGSLLPQVWCPSMFSPFHQTNGQAPALQNTVVWHALSFT